MREKITTIVNYINVVGLTVLSFILFFHYNLITMYSYLVFLISFVIEIFLERKWVNLNKSRNWMYFSLLMVFYLLGPISVLFDSTPKYAALLLPIRLPIIGFSVVGFFGLNDKFRLKYILWAFALSAITGICWLVFSKIGIHEFIHNPNRAVLFTDNRVKFLNNHMYFNFFMGLALSSVWYLAFHTDLGRLKVIWKSALLIIGLTVFYILSISEGRSGFLAGCAVLAIISFWELWNFKKKLAIGFLVLAPILFFVGVKHHRRMSDQEIKSEPRLFLWKSALPVIFESPIIGHGISNAQEKYDVSRTHFQTEEYRMWNISAFHLDCHNQYLQTGMEFGVLGLILLLLLYLYPIFIKRRDSWQTLLVLCFMSLSCNQSMFDMFITGQFCAIFCLLTVVSMQNFEEREAISNPLSRQVPTQE
jgi:O-antigen ligase